MNDVHGLEEWKQTVSEHLPHLSKPQAVVLAMLSFGMVLARSCAITAVTACLSMLLKVKLDTQHKRMREFCYDAEDKQGDQRVSVDVERCFAPLLRWVMSLWSGKKVALAMDATSLANRFTVLVVSVLYRGCAIPVAWVVMPGNKKQAWRREWLRMLRFIWQAIPKDTVVIVLADRGLYAPWLYRRIIRLRWHPFLRINGQGYFRMEGTKSFVPLTSLAPQVGAHWSGRGTAFKTSGRSLECTLLAHWGEGHAEAWFILTDMAPDQASACWYGMRAWIEHCFKITKRGGWQWHRTRMVDADRAARLWLAVAVATLWVVSVGGEVEEDMPESIEPGLAQALEGSSRQRKATRARMVSVFRNGWNRIIAALFRHEPLPEGRLIPEPWTQQADSGGILMENMEVVCVEEVLATAV